jgi:hypothetical protein
LVTPFGYADEEPVPKRKRLTAHSSPTLLHTIIDLHHAMTDVSDNGVNKLVEDKGKEYMDDGLDEEVDLDDEFDDEEDDEENDEEI